jgi:DHA1 family bicyclomycin/chloramphenicol resistance-like MFS transporter
MTKNKRFITILLLGLLTAIVPSSIDMYLPGFPEIAASFGTTVTRVALSLSSYFFGIGQLIYGPLLNGQRSGKSYAGLQGFLNMIS